MRIYPASAPLQHSLVIPGDKSISHRAVMFGSLAEGTTEITHFLPGADCLSTIGCFRRMGIDIESSGERVLVHGKGLHGLTAPKTTLDCGNSGTTMRLLAGILAGQSFSSTLTGDASIQRRPMRRVIQPLARMGAAITSKRGNDCAPLSIEGRPLGGITYRTPVASAQVKSCVLLAGLYADAPTTVIEPALSRSHTELMLQSFGASVQADAAARSVTVLPDPHLVGTSIDVPGDISSAAYFLCGAAMLPGSDVCLTNVGVNPTRSGILDVLRAMGGDVTLENEHSCGGEAVADLRVRYAPLHGTTIGGDLIPRLIDELPVLAVLAATAEGETVIRDAAELKVKESNRIDIMVEGLRRMGVSVEATPDGMVIQGGRPLHGASIDSHRDHRVAMSFAIAALAAERPTDISDASCVSISYPHFFDDLQKLSL